MPTLRKVFGEKRNGLLEKRKKKHRKLINIDSDEKLIKQNNVTKMDDWGQSKRDKREREKRKTNFFRLQSINYERRMQ